MKPTVTLDWILDTDYSYMPFIVTITYENISNYLTELIESVPSEELIKIKNTSSNTFNIPKNVLK